MNLKAFSKKEGDPSISVSANKTGLPMTEDVVGGLSLPAKEDIINHIISLSS